MKSLYNSLFIKRTVQVMLFISMLGCLKIEPVYLDWFNYTIEFPLGGFIGFLIFVLLFLSFLE